MTTSARLRRLREELAEVGFVLDPSDEAGMILLTEIDYALRPHVHERRVPSVGAIIEPTRRSRRGRSARSSSSRGDRSRRCR